MDGATSLAPGEVEGLLKLPDRRALRRCAGGERRRRAGRALPGARVRRRCGSAPASPAARLPTDRSPVTVRLEVAEGPHTIVSAVSFEGAAALTPAELLEADGAGHRQALLPAAVDHRLRRPSNGATVTSATSGRSSRCARRRPKTPAASPSPTWSVRGRRPASTTCWSAAPSGCRPTWCGARWRWSPDSRSATTRWSRASSG